MVMKDIRFIIKLESKGGGSMSTFLNFEDFGFLLKELITDKDNIRLIIERVEK